MRERQYITVSTQLTPEIVKRIEDESNERHISRAELIRELIGYAIESPSIRLGIFAMKGSRHAPVD